MVWCIVKPYTVATAAASKELLGGIKKLEVAVSLNKQRGQSSKK
jgi:hypothetical protein